MRKQVEYYNGFEITEEIIERVNLIEEKRIQEGLTNITTENIIFSLKDLCRIHGTFPKDENIILGEDWYILYTKYTEDEIGITEWLAIHNVPNKLIQTMEMFSAMKKILLENRNAKFFATMRHSTSYKFYQSLLTRGYLEEISSRPDIDEELPEDLEMIKNNIQEKYSSIEEYLLNSDKEQLEGIPLEDFIQHYITFKTTDKFTKKYKKQSPK